jgi:alginate O-acetyltransferase complex protein AlgI
VVFSDVFFLFAFLPVVLAIYFALPGIRLKNYFLIVASTVFYTWGEPKYGWALLVAVVIAYIFGRLMHTRPCFSNRLWLLSGVGLLILHLVMYKYAGFLVASLNVALGSSLPVPKTRLPIGISFFTFQAVSYLVDIYRKKTVRSQSLWGVALYITMFPQLIAGPIVRYAWIETSLWMRSIAMSDIADGARRFIIGLAKKVLIADILGQQVTHIFILEAAHRPLLLAWLGAIAYALQIYFDFSGYSDMAIGIGKMLGFRFPENFNYPYIADSVQDFWRRWHMTLSSWFKDYLYIPLGGNRRGVWMTARNLIVVFFLCGLWHGASWNFVAWGLYHGFFLVLERSAFGRVLASSPRFARHLYLIGVLLISWVIFYLEDFSAILGYLSDMFIWDGGSLGFDAVMVYAQGAFSLAMIVGIIACVPVKYHLGRLAGKVLQPQGQARHFAIDACMIGLLFLSAMFMASTTYSPFIYFRF